MLLGALYHAEVLSKRSAYIVRVIYGCKNVDIVNKRAL